MLRPVIPSTPSMVAATPGLRTPLKRAALSWRPGGEAVELAAVAVVAVGELLGHHRALGEREVGHVARQPEQDRLAGLLVDAGHRDAVGPQPPAVGAGVPAEQQHVVAPVGGRRGVAVAEHRRDEAPLDRDHVRGEEQAAGHREAQQPVEPDHGQPLLLQQLERLARAARRRGTAAPSRSPARTGSSRSSAQDQAVAGQEVDRGRATPSRAARPTSTAASSRPAARAARSGPTRVFAGHQLRRARAAAGSSASSVSARRKRTREAARRSVRSGRCGRGREAGSDPGRGGLSMPGRPFEATRRRRPSITSHTSHRRSDAPKALDRRSGRGSRRGEAGRYRSCLMAEPPRGRVHRLGRRRRARVPLALRRPRAGAGADRRSRSSAGSGPGAGRATTRSPPACCPPWAGPVRAPDPAPYEEPAAPRAGGPGGPRRSRAETAPQPGGRGPPRPRRRFRSGWVKAAAAALAGLPGRRTAVGLVAGRQGRHRPRRRPAGAQSGTTYLLVGQRQPRGPDPQGAAGVRHRQGRRAGARTRSCCCTPAPAPTC